MLKHFISHIGSFASAFYHFIRNINNLSNQQQIIKTIDEAYENFIDKATTELYGGTLDQQAQRQVYMRHIDNIFNGISSPNDLD